MYNIVIQSHSKKYIFVFLILSPFIFHYRNDIASLNQQFIVFAAWKNHYSSFDYFLINCHYLSTTIDKSIIPAPIIAIYIPRLYHSVSVSPKAVIYSLYFIPIKGPFRVRDVTSNFSTSEGLINVQNLLHDVRALLPAPHSPPSPTPIILNILNCFAFRLSLITIKLSRSGERLRSHKFEVLSTDNNYPESDM